MVVRILHLAGCKATPPTISIIEKVASELGLNITIEEIAISSQEEAIRLRHIGSPTVQVNGVDIDPSARDAAQFGMT